MGNVMNKSIVGKEEIEEWYKKRQKLKDDYTAGLVGKHWTHSRKKAVMDNVFYAKMLFYKRAYSKAGRFRQKKLLNELEYSTDKFERYMESQFEEGMTWENYGYWKIVQLTPFKNFNMRDSKEFLSACHYTNFMPVWRYRIE